MKAIVALGLLTVLFTGCASMSHEDDLRGVPVTNNPNLIPKSAQGQGAPF